MPTWAHFQATMTTRCTRVIGVTTATRPKPPATTCGSFDIAFFSSSFSPFFLLVSGHFSRSSPLYHYTRAVQACPSPPFPSSFPPAKRPSLSGADRCLQSELLSPPMHDSSAAPTASADAGGTRVLRICLPRPAGCPDPGGPSGFRRHPGARWPSR